MGHFRPVQPVCLPDNVRFAPKADLRWRRQKTTASYNDSCPLPSCRALLAWRPLRPWWLPTWQLLSPRDQHLGHSASFPQNWVF